MAKHPFRESCTVTNILHYTGDWASLGRFRVQFPEGRERNSLKFKLVRPVHKTVRSRHSTYFDLQQFADFLTNNGAVVVDTEYRKERHAPVGLRFQQTHPAEVEVLAVQLPGERCAVHRHAGAIPRDDGREP